MNHPEIILFLARADNGVIGDGDTIPWRLPEDQRRFKRMTMGKPMIMGRKTYDSIGRPLPGRSSIVVNRDPDYRAEGVMVVQTLEEAVMLGKNIAQTSGASDVAIVGGAEIYRQALSLAERIYLTEVHLSPDGDAVFEEIDRSMWQEISRHGVASDEGVPAYDITILQRNP